MPTIGRLKDRGDFLNVAQKGRRWVTPAFVIQVLENTHEDKDACYVGFTATKKTFKKAVDRNRTKRRLREIARLNLSGYALGSSHIVMIARQEALSRSFAEMEKDCHWALKKLEIKKV